MTPTGTPSPPSPAGAAALADTSEKAPQRCVTPAGTGVCGCSVSRLALTPQPRYAASVRRAQLALPSCSAWMPARSCAAWRSVALSTHGRTPPRSAGLPSVASVSSARKSSAGTSNAALKSSTLALRGAEASVSTSDVRGSADGTATPCTCKAGTRSACAARKSIFGGSVRKEMKHRKGQPPEHKGAPGG